MLFRVNDRDFDDSQTTWDIVDTFMLDLNLDDYMYIPGSGFTDPTAFSTSISSVTLSFRMNCSANYSGPTCTEIHYLYNYVHACMCHNVVVLALIHMPCSH